jgi:DNA repair protein RadD
VKVCEACGELCHPSAKECPSCKTPFPAPPPKKWKLSDIDIMGMDGSVLDVSAWRWRTHISRASGKEMIAVTYYGALSDPPVTEYLTIGYDGYPGDKAARQLRSLAAAAGVTRVALSPSLQPLDSIATEMNAGRPPKQIEYRLDGKYFRVIKREWNVAETV